ncbi:hypothetical protein [Aliiroseovarius subalbicans]|uniref:hypothetical protein n=1 Tax=Aliiroseovarius subalbicans TaxID=2925840 RepID=UPI001F576948|nr:hypothetical protein [uncultured Aliiroseovarius sp.]MCI2399445.1 hypothetical protein [Aliiroseovarius subalbicans]
MNAIVQLMHEETVRLDRDQLEVLYVQLGPVGADKLVNHALEELAVALARVQKQHSAGRIDEVRVGVKNMVAIAQQIGMTTLARVARDVLDLINTGDGAAYCATMARMGRIGESSLKAVWDLQDVHG